MSITKEKTALIVTVSGELDHHKASKLRTEIDKSFTSDVKSIIFDFSELDFMDSSGIGMIMGRYKKVRAVGGVLIIAAAKPQVKRILKISGLMNIVRLEATLAHAKKRI